MIKHAICPIGTLVSVFTLVVRKRAILACLKIFAIFFKLTKLFGPHLSMIQLQAWPNMEQVGVATEGYKFNLIYTIVNILLVIQIITIMYKRSVTPLNKDKPLSRNNSNHQKVFKDVKNIVANKQVLSRNPSNSKITFTNPTSFGAIQGVNPQSPDQVRHRETAKSYLINEEMRRIVVEWMLQISHRAVLRRETIFMAVHLFDAVLEKLRNVSTHNLQLVAIAAFFIAAKYEQIYPQNLHKFLEYTAHSYSKQQLLLMQQKILGEMQFKLTFPTRITHFGIMSQSNPNLPNSKKYHSLCLFLLELSLLVRWEDTKDTDLAEAISFLTKKVLKMPTGWTNDTVMQIAYKMMSIWRQNQKSVLAYFYDNQKYCFVGGLKIIY